MTDSDRFVKLGKKPWHDFHPEAVWTYNREAYTALLEIRGWLVSGEKCRSNNSKVFKG